MSPNSSLRNRKKKSINQSDSNQNENTLESSEFDETTEQANGLNWRLDQTQAALLQQRQQEMGKKMFRRAVKRVFLLIVALTTVYFYRRLTDPNVHTFASSRELIKSPISLRLACSVTDYQEDYQAFPSCVPSKCGRIVSDSIITPAEAIALLDLSKRLFNIKPTNSSYSFLNLETGKLRTEEDDSIDLKEHDFLIYRQVKEKMKQFVANSFGLDSKQLFLTEPTFVSRLKKSEELGDDVSKISNVHIDRHVYPKYHYTSIVYLSTYFKHFTGGRFMYLEGQGRNSSIEPRLGRVFAFTSGAENEHFVEPLEKGERFAITIPFTCNPDFSIQSPHLL